jgi:peptidoglycan/LPS O-acetylase OafA/YrhL
MQVQRQALLPAVHHAHSIRVRDRKLRSHPTPTEGYLLGLVFLLFPVVIGLAWAYLHYFDEPVRAWLTRRYVRKAAA